jgi:broad specificity phosphatase PhoE
MMPDGSERGTWGAPLLEALSRIPQDRPAAVLMRHSVRGPITDVLRPLDVPLSPEGRQAARALGRALPHRRVVLTYSPVPRCADTAFQLAEGVRESGGVAIDDGADDRLGGPYVFDATDVALRAAALGPAFMTEWREGRLPTAIIEPLSKAARGQLDRALAALARARPGELHVLVSHDWNLLAVREDVFDVHHEDAGWVDFLDGLVAVPDGTGARLVAACARPRPFPEVLLA